MDFLLRNVPFLLVGAANTVWLATFSIIFGTLLGVLLGVLAGVGTKPVRSLVGTYVYVVQGVPALITIFFIFYALPAWGFHVSNYTAGIVALSLYGAAFFAEIVRGGIAAIPRGQSEAGRALGMMKFGLMRHVILPQALRYAIPPYILIAGRLVRTTSIVYIVGVSELTLVAREIVARDNTPFQTLGLAMLFYFLLCYPLAILGTWLERRKSYIH